LRPKIDSEELEEIDTQDKGTPKEDNSKSQEVSLPKDEPKSSMLSVDSPPSSSKPKDENNSDIDFPQRPELETEGEYNQSPKLLGQVTAKAPNDSSDISKNSLLDGVDPTIVKKAEKKRNTEPSHPESQESPDGKEGFTPAEPSDAPKDSLLDGAKPSQAKEVEQYQSSDDKGMLQFLYRKTSALVRD